MARAAKLKVFRTAIGFHDAYVAAPSQKAALEAWGSDSNLFTQGFAERVDDPELSKEPLAHPGEVIRRPRGTFEEHMASLPAEQRSRRRSPRTDDEPVARSAAKATRPAKAGRATAEHKPTRKPAQPKPEKSKPPKPDRAPLDAAETAIAAAKARHREERDAITHRQAELDRDRKNLDAEQKRETAKLERQRDQVAASYDRAMAKWRR